MSNYDSYVKTVEISKLRDRIAELEAVTNRLLTTVNQVQNVLRIYLAPGDQRIQSEHETVNELLRLTDNADIIALQRKARALQRGGDEK